MNNYHLTNDIVKEGPYLKRLLRNIGEIFAYINKKAFYISLALALVGSATSVITPYLLGVSIDTYVAASDRAGLLRIIGILALVYIVGAVATYYQQNIMGKAAQSALYKIRAAIFGKLQSLPIAFFSQNKTGDLMSRVNNDSDKLSQFLSESILRFTGSVFTLLGIAVFVIYLEWRLGLALLVTTVFLLVFTRITAPILEQANKQSSGALGTFTAGVSEQLTNFKAIIAFNRRNFFEEFLSGLNKQTYTKSRLAAFLNQVFVPIYDFGSYIAQVIVLVYGTILISQGELTIGLLIGFLGFATRFYEPLRYMADIFGEIQIALASWGRIRDLLSLESNLVIDGHLSTAPQTRGEDGLLASSTHPALLFEKVSFGYNEEHQVLREVSFELEKGKTYALVGPTGGGKSTIANLMSRLYDPTKGVIVWKGKDMRSYDKDELASAVGVILQEPYMFTGTVAENIRYGNSKLTGMSAEEFSALLEAKGISELLKRLPEGLETKIETGGENISIGQKQLISFVRTVLREPELLVLDEATANIDTVTESTLQELIESLAPLTTKVIIAHRLNTIKKADEILFVSGGEVKRVSDEKEVLELLKGVSRS